MINHPYDVLIMAMFIFITLYLLMRVIGWII